MLRLYNLRVSGLCPRQAPEGRHHRRAGRADGPRENVEHVDTRVRGPGAAALQALRHLRGTQTETRRH